MNETATREEMIATYRTNMERGKTVELRKIARDLGIKVVGADHTPVNKGRKADLVDALVTSYDAELARHEEEKPEPAKKAKKTRKVVARDLESWPTDKTAKNSRKATGDENADGTLAIRTARRFVEAAQAKGWDVKIDNQMATEIGDVVVITAAKDEESITLRWIDGAYDYYQGGSFHTDAKGKARKILNTSAAINRYL